MRSLQPDLLGGEVITTELLIQMASHLSSRLLDLSKFAAPDVDLETEEWVGRLMRHVARREEAVGISSSEGRYKKGIYVRHFAAVPGEFHAEMIGFGSARHPRES